VKLKATAPSPKAVVMNMFYTGLGIARSLGEQGVSVIGLTAKRGVYGNFTRYAKVLSAPDSRNEPEALAAFLVKLGRGLDTPAVIFPTRDDDLVFLDRFRSDLAPYFRMVVPEHGALTACLNKWSTFLAAREAGVAAPKSWLIEGAEDLKRFAAEIVYPCVLKPLAAHHWRKGANWELVGARKAIGITSAQELAAEYATIARADKRALIQEMVPGGDDCLLIVACYLDQRSRWAGAFNTRKVLQIPEGFGTGCIVKSAAGPTLFDTTRRLLEGMRYSGIAEVEYKWDSAADEYKLIEVNPRPWDQHRLGNAAGVDLMYMAYCDHAGRSIPEPAKTIPEYKWIAEDTFITAASRSLRGGTSKAGTLFRLARGKRIYAIWSARDPLPAVVYWVTFIPALIDAGTRALWFALKNKVSGDGNLQKGELVYETHVEKPESLR